MYAEIKDKRIPFDDNFRIHAIRAEKGGLETQCQDDFKEHLLEMYFEEEPCCQIISDMMTLSYEPTKKKFNNLEEKLTHLAAKEIFSIMKKLLNFVIEPKDEYGSYQQNIKITEQELIDFRRYLNECYIPENT